MSARSSKFIGAQSCLAEGVLTLDSAVTELTLLIEDAKPYSEAVSAFLFDLRNQARDLQELASNYLTERESDARAAEI